MSDQSDIDEFNKFTHLAKIFLRHCDEFWKKNDVSERCALSAILSYAVMSISKISKSEEAFKTKLDQFSKLAELTLEEITKSGHWKKIKNNREEDNDRRI
jgi:hypothetical protein